MAGYRKFFRQWQKKSEQLQRETWAKQTKRLLEIQREVNEREEPHFEFFK